MSIVKKKLVSAGRPYNSIYDFPAKTDEDGNVIRPAGDMFRWSHIRNLHLKKDLNMFGISFLTGLEN